MQNIGCPPLRLKPYRYVQNGNHSVHLSIFHIFVPGIICSLCLYAYSGSTQTKLLKAGWKHRKTQLCTEMFCLKNSWKKMKPWCLRKFFWYCLFWNRFYLAQNTCKMHNYVIKLKHFPRYWPSLWGVNRSTVNSPHKGQWRGALCFLWSTSELIVE